MQSVIQRQVEVAVAQVKCSLISNRNNVADPQSKYICPSNRIPDKMLLMHEASWSGRKYVVSVYPGDGAVAIAQRR